MGTIFLQRIFSKTQTLSSEGNPVRALFSGDDDIAPMEYMGTVFDDDHTHYLGRAKNTPGHINSREGDQTCLARAEPRNGVRGAQRSS